MENFFFFIQQGFYHVLDFSALDHVLFFIALTITFSFKDWKKALWVITLFTFGHSFTFGLAAYNYLAITIDLVEFLIPITILIPLLLNSYFAIKKEAISVNNWSLCFAFFFGLIHGLGFSSYFKMLLDIDDNKLVPLLKFALGIEFAQIVIVFLVLLLGYIFHNVLDFKKRYWVIGVSFLLIIRIIPMLITRFP